jgi:hypothetical protein
MLSYFAGKTFLICSTGTLRTAKLPSDRYSYVVIDVEVFRSVHVLIRGECAVFHFNLIFFQSSLDSSS